MERKILIVEDNPVTQKVLRLALESEEYTVLEADSGEAALRIVEEHLPAVILQDVVLPDIDGFELVKRLRRLPAAASIPILCHSALIGPDAVQRVRRAGFTDLIPKPSSPADVISGVRMYLDDLQSYTPGQFVGRHVMVVDDDPVQRKLLTLRLRSAGARVTTAENGTDALNKLRVDMPDAILSDVLMPECDGFALCGAVRADPRFAGLPIVLVSSQYVEDDDAALARRIGANALVLRASDMAPLFAALTETFTQPAPLPSAEAHSLQAEHLRRLMRQVHRQALERERIERTQTWYGILAGFLEHVAQAQACSGKPAVTLDEILVRYLDACGYPTGAIYLVDADGTFVPHALRGVPNTKATGWRDFFGQATLLKDAGNGTVPRAFSVEDPTPRPELAAAGVASMVLCPLRLDGRLLGMLVLGSQRRTIDPHWLALAHAAAGPISLTVAFARTLAALIASEQRIRSVAESLSDAVIITDEQGTIVYANAAAGTIFGYPADDMCGWNSAHLSSLLTGRASVWEGHVTHRDGREIPINGTTTVVLHPERPDRLTYTHVIHDLSVKEHMEQLYRVANYDPLCQVYNRRFFDEALRLSISEAQHEGARGAVLLLDLDYFKQINDWFGHAAGDAALIAFADALRGAVRQSDVVARLGGDEFAILAPCADAPQAAAFATKLLAAVAARPIHHSDETIRLSASIGIALYDKQAVTPQALLDEADQALYQAKHDGRRCYRIFCSGKPTTAVNRRGRLS